MYFCSKFWIRTYLGKFLRYLWPKNKFFYGSVLSYEKILWTHIWSRYTGLVSVPQDTLWISCRVQFQVIKLQNISRLCWHLFFVSLQWVSISSILVRLMTSLSCTSTWTVLRWRSHVPNVQHANAFWLMEDAETAMQILLYWHSHAANVKHANAF